MFNSNIFNKTFFFILYISFVRSDSSKPFNNYCSNKNDTMHIVQSYNNNCQDEIVYTVEAASDKYDGEMFFGLYSPYNVKCNWGTCESNISASYNFMVFEDCIPQTLPEIYDSPSSGRTIKLNQKPYSSNKFIILLKKRDNNQCTYRLSKGSLWTAGGILCTPPYRESSDFKHLMCKENNEKLDQNLIIGLGVIIFILLTLIIVYYIIRRRRKYLKLCEKYQRLDNSISIQTDDYNGMGSIINIDYHKL